MNLVNEQTEHAVFGVGNIIEQESGYVVIQFSEQFGTKRFVYPDAFEGYLKLINKRLEEEVQLEMRLRKERIEAVKAKKKQEYEEEIESKKVEKLELAALKRKTTKKATERKPGKPK